MPGWPDNKYDVLHDLLHTALLIRQIGGPRASRLLLCVMLADQVADSCSNAAPRIFETAAAGIRRGLTKTAIAVPWHSTFSLRGYRPAPRLG